jgi:cysteine desulfuration protein SufE
MSIESKAQELIDDFSIFSDWNEKYEYIIDLGKSLDAMNENEKTDDLLIKGCQSRVWLKANFDGENMHYTADSDALIPKGIAALMIKVMNNEKPENIVNAKLDFIDTIGLKEHLSPTRSNGLVSMVDRIKQLALQHISK